MSDTPANLIPSLDIREQVARIDLAIAENAKFQAEAAKLRRDHAMAPWQFAAALMGAGAAMFGAGAAFWKVVGG